MNFTDVLKDLTEAQTAEHDNRERLREIDQFLHAKDGQWESTVLANMTGRPKYQFDRCGQVTDSIMGELEQSDFSVRLIPSGGGATKELAKTRSGIIRKVESMSGAKFIYNQAARSMVEKGLAGWRVSHDWVDSNSFYQDLQIKRISNFLDRVWYDPNAEEPDMSDAVYCFVLSSLTKAAYDKKHPKGSGMSVGFDAISDSYQYRKPDEIIVAEYLYKQPKKTDLVLMSNGAVYVVDDKFNKVKDELAQQQITVVRSRVAKVDVVYQSYFDGKDWLGDKEKTVFQYLPIVPVFGNFEIAERKLVYKGAVEPLMDPQRVLNYAESRKIEEGALAPREKLLMTKQQSAGHGAQLRSMNINPDPVQFYNHVEGHVPPYKIQGPQVNPALTETTTAMNQHINLTSGSFQAERAQNRGLGVQSGAAIERLENKENSTNFKYFQSMEIAIRHTALILNAALPVVYDTSRAVPILNEEGGHDEIVLNQKIIDQQTGHVVELNNLTTGIYQITCTAGKAFQNQQQATVETLINIAKVDPSIMELGSDIMLTNINAPGIDKIAERKRLQMVQQGVIPDSQMTEEEKQMLQQMQQEKQQNPDPMVIAAQAEAEKAKADIAKAQTQMHDVISKMKERQDKTALEIEKIKLQNQKLIVDTQEKAANIKLTTQDQMLKQMEMQSEELKTQAETLKILKEVFAPDLAEKQKQLISQSQN